MLYSEDDAYLMYGRKDEEFPHIFISRPFDGLPATWSNGFHIAFNSADSETVDRFHSTALAHGGFDEGGPGLRFQYAEDYYGAYIRDPDGNKLQVVCYQQGRSSGYTGIDISHITLGHTDLLKARKFYGAVFDILGYVDKPEEGDDTSCGFAYPDEELPVVYIQQPFDGRPASWGNGTHTAFHAPTRVAVQAFHTAALANGGTDDGAPGLRPHYSANYYACYVLDPFGNKLQAVCRKPA